MKYTAVIGLEVHVQLLTESKLFCGCVNRFNPQNPNAQTCPVCLGLPGALPVLNDEALQLSVRTALALNGTVARFTKWDRKQYFYPDLPKGYQISQYDMPLSSGGWLDIPADAEPRRIRFIRAHLEEDAGKNIHDETGRGGDSQVDLNRTGTPLLEIVTEPDLRSAEDAKAFLEQLKLLLSYIRVSDCNMQEGSLRCDANVNLHVANDDGDPIATPIVEIKNLNSFRGVQAALEYEIERQVRVWEETGHRLGDVPKQTRGWDANRNVTFEQRGKEEASDYRYFPDPDLVPVVLDDADVEKARDSLCELPAAKSSRFQTEFGLSAYDAGVIVGQGEAFADYFESVASACQSGKLASNWVTQDVLRELREQDVEIDEFSIGADVLGELLKRIADKQITTRSGRDVFARMVSDEATPDKARIDQIIEEEGLAATPADDSAMNELIDRIIAGNEKAANDFRSGKQAALGPLIGQVMRELKGADPKDVRAALVSRLTD